MTSDLPVFYAENPRYVRILGVPISCVNAQEVINKIETWQKTKSKHFVCVREVGGVIEANKNAEMLKAHFSAGMVVPDGMPLVWIAKWRGFKNAVRICGRDLFSLVMKYSERSGGSHYFYGGSEKVLKGLVEEVRFRFPAAKIAGVESPPFFESERYLTSEKIQEIADRINATGASFIWVGVGSPKQELWMQKMRPHLEATALFGVGAVFDFYSGNKAIAPKWMQSFGLEWLFRFLSEPKRLWRRYLIGNPLFVFGIFLEEGKRLLWKRS